MSAAADIEETRAALAPTLEAAADILPWVKKPRPPRFPPEVAGRWQTAAAQLAVAWSRRHEDGVDAFRPAVFALLTVAVESGDIDCLSVGEALAAAADRLEDPARMREPRLIAAVSATLECLVDKDGLEHPAFPERARHFAARLVRCSDPQEEPPVRSPLIDGLFVGEAGECMERIRDALAALPPDIYAMKLAAAEISALAEPLELDDIGALAARLERLAAPPADLESPATRNELEILLALLAEAIMQVGAH